MAAGLQAAIARKGEFDLRHAQRLCKQYPSSAASVVKAMLAKAGRPLPEIEKAMTESLEHEATRLYANVRVQNLTFNVAPMLGLAGTVHGMILCFYSTAHMAVGQNKMDALATGIYAALICTLAGLLVAIPAGILSHYFEGRILKMFQKVEDLARSLVPHLERFEGRPRHLVSDDKPSRGPSIIEMPRDDGDPDDDDVDPIRTLIENGRRDRDVDNPLPVPPSRRRRNVSGTPLRVPPTSGTRSVPDTFQTPEPETMAVRIKKGSEMMQLPVVPLVDTLIVLFVFFLVATKVAEAEKELPIQAPYAGEAQAITARPAEMIINIDQKGHYFIGDQPATLHELNLALRNSWLTSRGRTPVTLRADERCSWKFVVQVIDCCKKNKVRDYHVTTKDAEAEGKT